MVGFEMKEGVVDMKKKKEKEKERSGLEVNNVIIYGSQEYDYDDVSLGIYGIDEDGKVDVKGKKFMDKLDRDLAKIIAKAPTKEEVIARNKKNGIR